MKRLLYFLFLLPALLCSACGPASDQSGTSIEIDFPGYWHLDVTQVAGAATAQDNSNQPQGTHLVAFQVTATNIQKSDPTGAGSQISVGDFTLSGTGNNPGVIPHVTLYDIHSTYDFPDRRILPGKAGTVVMYFSVPTTGGKYLMEFQLHAVITGTHVQWYITIPSAN